MAKKLSSKRKVARFSIQTYDNAHYKQTEAYTRAVDALFDAATLAITQEAAKGTYDPAKQFKWEDAPAVKAVMQRTTKQLAAKMTAVIETGSRKQWLFANDKNNAFIESIMDTSKLSKARLRKMQDRNLDGLAAFQARKVDGMNLSQRVWRYVGQYKDQMETALDVGLGEGRTAQQLARDVRQNLREPNRLFRRVRDKHGNLVLSKAAKAYHPGRGVYRSSVKNAQRLTRSEINMAYREADWQRWQTLDFVVGFEIKRSNHDPLCDCKLCDKLKGRYPKAFKFKGWHPQCMCYAAPILSDEDEYDQDELGDLKAALHGTTYEHKASRNTVIDVPDGFKEWVGANLEKQDDWGSVPYFIKDNFKNGRLADGLAFEPVKVENVVAQAVKHTPYLDLSDEERRKYRAMFQRLDDETEELQDACREYGINIDAFLDLVIDVTAGYDNKVQYWRYDEAVAMRDRLEVEVRAAIAATKVKVEAIIAKLRADADEAGKWVDVRKWYANANNAEQFIKGEEANEKYPRLKSLLTATSLNHDFTAEIDAMRVKYDKAIADAKAIIAAPAGRDVSELQHLVTLKPGYANAAVDIVADIEDAITKANAGNVVATNMADIEKAIGVKPGDPMTFKEANEHKANLDYKMSFADAVNEAPYPAGVIKEHPYHINCQSCVVAHELRRRGFDVETMPNYDQPGNKTRELSFDTNKIWIDPATGKQPKENRFDAWGAGIKRTSKKAKKAAFDFFNEATKEVGRYSLQYSWKVGNYTGGHIITCERLADGTLRVYDPQTGKICDLMNDICEVINYTRWHPCGIQRVDGMAVNTSMVADIVRKKK